MIITNFLVEFILTVFKFKKKSVVSYSRHQKNVSVSVIVVRS